MAIFNGEFFSTSIKRMVPFNIVLPNDVPPFIVGVNPNYQRPMKLMIVLHGYNGTQTDWLYGSHISELAGKYNMAIVSPAADNSFWLNDPMGYANYCDYVGKELPEYVRRTFGIPGGKENTFIGGYSMGGFGAIHTAAAYPETFSKVIALSSAYILHNISGLEPGFTDPVCDYNGYVRIFGDLDNILESDSNPEVLLRRLKDEGGEIPGLFLACGLEDFLLSENHLLVDFLKENDIPHEYHESHGIHNWEFWNTWFEPGIQWALGIGDETKDAEHVIGRE